jgi:hypothetical protein
MLKQVQSAADAWVQATYACGVEDGRHGLRSVYGARQPEVVERRFRDVAARHGASIWKLADQSRHRSMDTLSGATSVTASCSRTAPGEAFL